MKYIMIVALCLLVLSALPVAAEVATSGPKAPRSMLICYLSSPDDYQARSAGAAIARMLRYRASNLPQLSNLPPFNVVERVLQQEGLSPRLSLEMPVALRVARTSGQEWAVVGTARRDNDTFTFTLEIHGAHTGALIGKPITVQGKAEDIPSLERDLAKALFGGIGLQLTEQQESDLGMPLTNDHSAVRFLGDYLLAAESAASGLLDKALIADSRFPVTGVHRAQRALDEGRYSDAIIVTKEWRRRLPHNRDFSSCEFGAQLASERYDDAGKLLETMEADYPDSFSLVLLRHWLCRIAGDYAGALEYANRLVALNAFSPEAQARVCAASLDRAIDLSADMYLSQMTPEQAAAFAGAIDSAIAAGESACRMDGKYQQVWVHLMTAYREKGEYEKCEQAFRHLMSLNAGHRDARLSQALTYLCQKNTASARSLLEALAKATPSDPEVLLASGLCYKMEGDDASAVEQRLMAVSLDERCADIKRLRFRSRWPIELAHAAARL